MATEMRVCRGQCQRNLPLNSTNFQPLKHRGEDKFDTVCRECRNANQRGKRQTQRHFSGTLTADWATKYAQVLKARATKHEELLDPSIDPETLRILMEAQNQRCNLTGVTLKFPSVEELVEYGNLGKWAKTLTDKEKQRIPELVRVVKSGGWLAGNVELVASVLMPLYDRWGDSANVRDVSRKIAKYEAGVLQLDSIIKIRQQRARPIEQKEQHSDTDLPVR
jgi:hypothetical protein